MKSNNAKPPVGALARLADYGDDSSEESTSVESSDSEEVEMVASSCSTQAGSAGINDSKIVANPCYVQEVSARIEDEKVVVNPCYVQEDSAMIEDPNIVANPCYDQRHSDGVKDSTIVANPCYAQEDSAGIEDIKITAAPGEVNVKMEQSVMETKIGDMDVAGTASVVPALVKVEEVAILKETIVVEDDVEETKPNVKAYRERKISSASSASSSEESDAEFSSDTSDSDDSVSDSENPKEKTAEKQQVKKKKPVPCVKGELFLEDLDPIVDLQISVPENKVDLIGKVVNVVQCLITIESFEKKPALDLNTVLFIEEGRKAIGHIFEVFGRTSQPYYCVRFNSPEHVKERGIEIGTLIYAAPGTEHTRYVFLAQLERLRGTDASWKDDHEAPSEFLEFSDDETEKFIKNKNRKPRPRKNMPLDRSFPPDSNVSQEIPEENRLARKRNFSHNPGFGVQPNGNRFGQPRPTGFIPPSGFGAPGPFRPTFAQHCYRPVVPEFASPQGFYGAPRYGSIDPYGNHRFGPPPPNPFSVGGAAVTYRPPYENTPNGWTNYDYPRNHNPSYWNPPPHVFNYQAAWGAYPYQPFTVAQPPPPPPQPIVGAPVLNKDAIAAKTSA